jgi:archaeal chaperonin
MAQDKPIYILPENVQRTLGKDAQRNNILAAKLVADSVKTTLGPKGMDKMLVDSAGNITVTNDGVTILEEMEIEHPAAKMMVEIARTQEEEVGDGTTTAVLLAGKLLEKAENLLDKKIHPTVVIKGYKLAAKKSEKVLKEISKQVSYKQQEVLKYIAMTAMTGKGAETAKEKLAEIIVQSISQVGEITGEGNGRVKIDLNDIKIEKSKGQAIEDSELIRGIVLDKEKVSIDMPTRINNAKIALIDFPIEVRSPEAEAKITIANPDQLQGFIDREETMLKSIVDKIIKTQARVVFCQKGIDDIAQYYLAKQGIYACRRVAKSDMEKLARATSGHIVSSINELTDKELGSAKVVREVQQGEEKMTYVEGCENPKAVSILLRGSSDHVLDEIQRAVKDGLGDVASVLKQGRIVAGAGATEIELSKRLRDFANSLKGREQLAVQEFANALEEIPMALAENAGLDPIDIITELKSRHEKGEIDAGINILTNNIENALEQGIIEPLKIKLQAISSASEVAMVILRIDDVLASDRSPAGNNGANPYMGID